MPEPLRVSADNAGLFRSIVRDLGVPDAAWQEGASITPAEARPCRACGESMTEATVITVGTQRHLVFRHETHCRKLLELERVENLRHNRASLALKLLAETRMPRPTLHRPSQALVDRLAVWDEVYRAAWAAPEASHFRARLIARRFLDALAQKRCLPQGGFTFAGPVGVGKTTLMRALATDLVLAYVGAGLITRMRSPLVWRREQELFTAYTDQMNHPQFTGETFIREHVRAPFLVIDNLGGQDPSPWWLDNVLFQILDGRYQEARPTLYTSKYLTLDALRARWRVSVKGKTAACLDDLIDRLEHHTAWVPIQAPSFRQPEVDF